MEELHMTSTSKPNFAALETVSETLTRALGCYLENIALAEDSPSLEGPLAFAFAAGYREAFKDVVVTLTDDTEDDAYEYTCDPSEFISALLTVVPSDNPALAAAMYAATDYWTQPVPEGSRLQRLPAALPSNKQPSTKE
jgi:hypothetical protein